MIHFWLNLASYGFDYINEPFSKLIKYCTFILGRSLNYEANCFVFQNCNWRMYYTETSSLNRVIRRLNETLLCLAGESGPILNGCTGVYIALDHPVAEIIRSNKRTILYTMQYVMNADCRGQSRQVIILHGLWLRSSSCMHRV